MPLDAVFLRLLADELSRDLVGARIDKIHQPERDELTFSLRARSGNRRLLLSAAVGSARLHFLDDARENPATPPNFCMLLRKHIGGGRITRIEQVENERILFIDIDATDEMLEPVCRRIVIELIGSQPNIVLTSEDGRILDAIRRIEGDLAAGKRQILPGLFYEAPKRQEKLSLSEQMSDIAELTSAASDDAQIERFLIKTVAGVSPPVAREIAYRAAGDASAMLGGHKQKVKEQLATLAAFLSSASVEAETSGFSPTITYRDGCPFEYGYMRFSQYESGASYETYPTFSELLQAFYGTRDLQERLRRRSREISKVLQNATERLQKKLSAQKGELSEAKNREQLRRFADLIMANIHAIPRGKESVTLFDFYDETQTEIPLDVRLNAQQNAAKYYKDYARKKNAEKILNTLIANGENELFYLDSVKAELASARLEQDVEAVRDELEQAGYLRKKSRKKAQDTRRPIRYTTTGGFTVLVGRNNLENDRLTFSEASKNDIWLHAQKAHGAHVILRTDGNEPDDASYTEAGMIAAYHSEKRDGAMVAVDYTRIKQIKKPPSAKPGMVIYEQYYTMYVQPDEKLHLLVTD